MKSDSVLIREILRYVRLFRGAGIFIAPADLGPLGRDDLEILLKDIELLASLGVNIVAIDYGNTGKKIWGGLERPANVPFLSIPSPSLLVPTAVENGVKKICLAANTDRVTTADGPLNDVTLAETERVFANMSENDPYRPALEIAVSACRSGVSRVHLFNATRHGALLEELFTDRGVGTMFYAGTPHREIRLARAEDRFDVYELLHDTPHEKPMAYVCEHLDEVRMFTIDGAIHGITQVSKVDTELVVRMIHHSNRFNAAEVLEQLLRAILDEAHSEGVTTVRIIPTEIPALMRIQPWFMRLGFRMSKGITTDRENADAAWIKKVA